MYGIHKRGATTRDWCFETQTARKVWNVRLEAQPETRTESSDGHYGPEELDDFA